MRALQESPQETRGEIQPREHGMVSRYDLFPTTASFDRKYVSWVLDSYGGYETWETPSGDTITLLLPCSVPVETLIPDNWGVAVPMGNTRGVRGIDTLKNGSRVNIVVKSPERVFAVEPTVKDDIWWGGTRSGQRGIYIGDNAVVEEQAAWEAAMLLALYMHGIRAEVPQAIIEKRDGTSVVVVNEILASARGLRRGPSTKEILAQAEQFGFIPVDANDRNILTDTDGYNRIIDVNRWLWSPYADEHRRRLHDVIQAAKAA